MMSADKKSQEKPVSSFVQSIDHSTIQLMLQYFRFEDYDSLVSYVQKIGIKIAPANQEPR